MNLGDKRGQFYIIAALVIVSIISGLVVLTNTSEKKDFNKVNDLKEELEIESGKVLDYGVLNNDDQIKNFTKNFSDYAGAEVNIYYIVGNASNIEAYSYVNSIKTPMTLTPKTGGNVSVTIEDYDYEFDVNPGENFYFIISQDIEGERYIATN